MMAPKLAALMTQQVISKSHLLIVLSDALYKASFFSIRCVKSSFRGSRGVWLVRNLKLYSCSLDICIL
jgi:hypothetical protein